MEGAKPIFQYGRPNLVNQRQYKPQIVDTGQSQSQQFFGPEQMAQIRR
tara:strand:- start:65 stop:208 length:144 start_codon:yes stop_codon:yes gene_type:complete